MSVFLQCPSLCQISRRPDSMVTPHTRSRLENWKGQRVLGILGASDFGTNIFVAHSQGCKHQMCSCCVGALDFGSCSNAFAVYAVVCQCLLAQNWVCAEVYCCCLQWPAAIGTVAQLWRQYCDLLIGIAGLVSTPVQT